MVLSDKTKGNFGIHVPVAQTSIKNYKENQIKKKKKKNNQKSKNIKQIDTIWAERIEDMENEIEYLIMENAINQYFPEYLSDDGMREYSEVEIVAFGKENYNFLTTREIINVFNLGEYCIPGLISLIHFNDRKPEHHNMYLDNLKDKRIWIFDGKNWHREDRDAIMDYVYDKADYFLIKKRIVLDSKISREYFHHLFCKLLKLKNRIDAFQEKRQIFSSKSF